MTPLDIISEIASGLWAQTYLFLTGMMRVWNLYQLAILAGLIVAAFGLSYVVGPLLHNWLRAQEGWPKWRLRLFLVLHRRLRLILFVAMI